MLFRRLNVVISSLKINLWRKLKFSSTSTSRRLGKMQDGFVEINSVPTHIYTWGQWIEDKFDDQKKEIVLIITGNPGLPGFYTIFGSTLYNELDKQVPVWVIGHAGHDEPKKELNMKTPPLKGNEELYDLAGQLNHKIDFINRYIPKDIKIFLIGHSIGSKFCLDLLKIPDFSDKVQQCFLMFPTVERMAESEKGRQVPMYDRFIFLLRIFYNLFSFLPLSWKRSIVRWQCRREGMPGDEFLEPSLEYTNPPVIDRIWFMALDEMAKVREIDEEAVKANIHRLKLYYGATDGWVPTQYYHEIIERFPGINAELCKQGYEHAFVLKTGSEVGKMVVDWMNLARQVKKQ